VREDSDLDLADDLAVTDLEDDERFFIDAIWYDDNDLEFNEIVQARMCAQCQARLGEETEERYPVADRRTGRVTYEVRQVRYGSRPIAVIRDCCSRKTGFITPEMPVLEAVFRILLANANQPMTLDYMRDQLREWCPTGRCQWLLMPPEVLRQVILGDHYYGLRLHELPGVA
jgi:hypothetical protein